MKVSYNWLQSYFNSKLPTPEKVAELLTNHTFEVEGVIKQGIGLENVVVGEVLEKIKHPNADKLSLVKIKVGADKTLSIVCGAPNIEAGQKVPVALIGASLPNGMTIEKREVRGEVSHGMVCSASELGLEKKSEGIMVLDKKTKIGTSIVKVLGLNDSVLDISVLPNRNHDCLCHTGIAREVATLTGLKIKEPVSKVKTGTVTRKIKIENKADKLCPRYMARVVENVKNGTSEKIIKESIEAIGQRSISSIVDATNFVMLECGQPLHAFDADKISGNKIIIRRAKKGEKFITLDNQEFELDENVLLIADEKDALAIAGIKGGRKAEVDENTKNIVIEAANFDQANIRATSQRLGIKTDSSLRYENGITPELTAKGMERVTEIILKSAGGKAGVVAYVYPKKSRQITVALFPERVSKFTGIEISKKEIADILKKLNFKFKDKKTFFEVFVPAERIDIAYEEDLIEEVVRIYGYHKIKSVLPEEMLLPTKINDNVVASNLVKDILVGAGFTEVYNYSFSKEGEVELANPIDKSKKFLKTELISGLKENVKFNSANFKTIKIFEIGKVFPAQGETVSFAGAIYNGKFIDTKGTVEMVLEGLGISNYWFEPHEQKLSGVMIGNTEVGHVGHDGWEINFEMLVRAMEEKMEFSPISRFPSVKRDIALFVPVETRMVEVEDVVENAGGELLRETELFDIYEKEGDENKSLAFHLIFQSYEKTLNEAEINEIMNNVFKAVEAKGWEVRK